MKMNETPRYTLVRSTRRKTAAIKVDHQGVKVSVPERADPLWVERWVASKADWIALQQEKLARQQRCHGIRISQGAVIPLLGESLQLGWEIGSRNQVSKAPGRLNVLLSSRGRGADDERVSRLLQQWFKSQAAEIFEPRLQQWSQQMGLEYSGFKVKGYRRRWGSCDNRGAISLNWRLILVPPELLDYVIVHELSHLQHFNHGNAFWKLVERYYPEWRQAKEALQQRDALLEF
ncbi:M48 family metallopeptidase [Marinobacterium jannaschii]|uniref:M48 family metallopeptidase n=1 Tax=Marinobacterium jannaschii TaxID=64970 RepID=UPI0006870816|nr:SprT family zinc-dependent metalloprotease [Marinobacterium jannaschii]